MVAITFGFLSEVSLAFLIFSKPVESIPKNGQEGNLKSTAFGYGEKTTGGGSAPEQTPSSKKELESWLKDSTPRTIIIDRTFDFTDTEGNKTEQGCAPWPECPTEKDVVQHAINANNWCSKDAKKVSVTYRVAAIHPLEIGNNKTIKGVGKSGIIKGKGLLVLMNKNVIIQNLHITFLNPHLVGGGDAVILNGAENVWVDHCTFSLIGRQMISMGGEKNLGVTLSNNHFKGKTRWSTGCLHRNSWAGLIDGPDTTVTMANNCLDHLSGRSPKTGGSQKDKVMVHYYNNIHTQCEEHGLDVSEGSTMLAEGNLFLQSGTVNPGDAISEAGGQAYIPLIEQESSQCQYYLRRSCVTNEVVNSVQCQIHKNYKFPVNLGALEKFKGQVIVRTADIRPAQELANSGTPGGCGFGNI